MFLKEAQRSCSYWTVKCACISPARDNGERVLWNAIEATESTAQQGQSFIEFNTLAEAHLKAQISL